MKQKEKLKLIALRISEKMHEELVKLTIDTSSKTGKIITLSKIIRGILKEKLNEKTT